MSRFLQEFFWTPVEQVEWVRKVCATRESWVVVWPIEEDARVIDPSELRPELFVGCTEDSIQLFLGNSKTLGTPTWRNATRKRELDFVQSYAVQFVPSVISPDHKALLQGRLAILSEFQYEDATRAQTLVTSFKRLQSDMRRASDRDHIIVQRLSIGERKVWRNVLVGRAVPTFGTLQLKQFATGEVVFQIEAAGP